MPTGVHLRDARGQLFDAAERVLLRDGPSALTSRAVTDEAGCAKGVLHRHFGDFDAFLAELVNDRAARLRSQVDSLRESVGANTVVENLTGAMSVLFGPVPMAIIPLVTFREALRARLRSDRPGGGVAILAEATTAISAYLRDERDRGRIDAGADIDALTLSLVGGGHLLFAGHDPGPPGPEAVEGFVAAVLTKAQPGG
ncbi:TetR family transcriptional regulator [Stackebrandtia albiflava]|uniref:TetR family transcriptional regulator n=1 Tax=Stackebrandtia albiflava TaxID=406432 RepID=A0A562UQ61_9ACTN|nr:TetR/AcrR family transcriptional regulator [Stackebrandtia albiflava]TWJ07734.1 TetR family transcriptional regulator [Stackebrandtia albiflava]